MNQGVKVADNQNSLKAGLRGPSLLEAFIVREKITHFDHGPVLERVVHVRDAWAHGYFECCESLVLTAIAGKLATRVTNRRSTRVARHSISPFIRGRPCAATGRIAATVPWHVDCSTLDTGFAKDTGSTHKEAAMAGYSSTRSDTVAQNETSGLIAASKVEGTDVYNRRGESLGSIYDVMIEKRSGKVAYAVMSFGGFLGMGERYHPLPWAVLDYDERQGGYVVELDKERLQKAPSYGVNETPDWSNRDYGRRIDEYYGVPPGGGI